MILECDWEAAYGQVATKEGVATEVVAFGWISDIFKSLSDCKRLCLERPFCWSIAFHPWQDPYFGNCYLNIKVLTKLSSFVSKDDWTTYYCTNEG